MAEPHEGTLPIETAREGAREIPRVSLTVVEGPEPGHTFESSKEVVSIGSDPMNDLVLADPTVSRFHCEVRLEPPGVRLVDIKSLNGTVVGGLRIRDVYLEEGAVIRVGKTALRFHAAADRVAIAYSARHRFGSLIGSSVAMRTTFALLERVAPTGTTVLLEAETGCGKGQAAESIHGASTRRHGPFVIVDAGALPPSLLESELFGHEKGAFTGAQSRRIGAFEAANGGTLFLDEVGELPAELQPKLLRVLENKHVRRLGSNAYVPIDVRVIAATNRDLRADVNAGRFRSDLYFRLAVVRITLPPLRARPEDIPSLADHILASLGAGAEDRQRLLTPAYLEELSRARWPGNVRELRNALERALIFPEGVSGEDVVPESQSVASGSYAEAKEQAIAQFEQRYVSRLLKEHDGKVAQAANAAGLSREYLYRLMRRHKLGG
jgi:two-component system, NtrC family, response regulator GlrR